MTASSIEASNIPKTLGDVRDKERAREKWVEEHIERKHDEAGIVGKSNLELDKLRQRVRMAEGRVAKKESAAKKKRKERREEEKKQLKEKLKKVKDLFDKTGPLGLIALILFVGLIINLILNVFIYMDFFGISKYQHYIDIYFVWFMGAIIIYTLLTSKKSEDIKVAFDDINL